MKKVVGLVLLIVVLGVTLTACGKSKSKSNEEQVLMNGEYVSEQDAAAMEKAEVKAAKKAAREAEK